MKNIFKGILCVGFLLAHTQLTLNAMDSAQTQEDLCLLLNKKRFDTFGNLNPFISGMASFFEIDTAARAEIFQRYNVLREQGRLTDDSAINSLATDFWEGRFCDPANLDQRRLASFIECIENRNIYGASIIISKEYRLIKKYASISCSCFVVCAILLNDLKMAQECLENGANANLPFHAGYTNLIQHLLDFNPSLLPNELRLLAATSDGAYPFLDFVRRPGSDDHISVGLGMTSKTSIDSKRTANGCTALFLACYQNKPDFVTMLLFYGANPLQADNVGGTPLHACSSSPEAQTALNRGLEQFEECKGP